MLIALSGSTPPKYLYTGFPPSLVSFARATTPHIFYKCLCRAWEGINIALKILPVWQSAQEAQCRSYTVRSPAIIALASINSGSCCQPESAAGEQGLQLKQKHWEHKHTYKHLSARNPKTTDFEIHCTQN